ncbi:HEPN domain-containing protein [Bradyrhizobium zhanjiangense]|uniref:HEPN domain-containing protein n=1 Tax=Bradyrhizobium zhanjiangense TaxID=1325107 RepID=UPI0010088576|nr:HEPN domain-containing protein [Bradyrhizobium zhanjiangense]
MSSEQGFQFTVEEIERQICALYDLEDAADERLAEGCDPSVDQKDAGRIREYFERLADLLRKDGAFESKQEARRFVCADADALQRIGGVDGIVPDDGTLPANEIAQGIVAMRSLNKFFFQAPLCYSPQRFSSRPSIDCASQAGDLEFRLSSSYSDLLLVKLHPELQVEDRAEEFLWIEGCVHAHRYDIARRNIDLFLVSTMAVMEVIGLLHYRTLPGATCSLSIGSRHRINSGEYLDLISVQTSKHLVGLRAPVPGNEIDAARGPQSRLETNLRVFVRAMADVSPAAVAARHACRMYLRSYGGWNVGEAAMFLAITMEGLLLDKRQKDDLSARLQDSVAYWLAGSSVERENNRKRISELYKVRSNYVHNGEDAPPSFDIDTMRDLTRRVLRKELLTLAEHP